MFLKICKHVLYCHSKGVVHKDIKMDNIMIRSNGEMRLIDFGFSEILPRESGSKPKFCGTPYYIPPEFLKKLNFHSKTLL
jgi:MAP/microtubule affinity-regulating kinase